MANCALRDRLETAKYIPILSIRPAEMVALENLPEHDKDLMLPVIQFRPWVNAAEFQDSLDKINEAYGNRTVIADLDHFYDVGEDNNKSSTLFMKKLADETSGFKNWCDFVALNDFMIPCLQFGKNPRETPEQLKALLALGRGLVVRIPKVGLGNLAAILRALSGVDPKLLLFILDYGKPDPNDLTNVATCLGLLETIFKEFPNCMLSVSATTFPSSFEGLSKQSIKEREFHTVLSRAFRLAPIIYSDWGSARAERNSGGGPEIVPRVDFPLSSVWRFHRCRVTIEDKKKVPNDKKKPVLKNAYMKAALELVNDVALWSQRMPIWGTKMIELTAKGDAFGIVSPVRSTAVRINLHLRRQLYFNNPMQAQKDADDDWVD
jgi:Beta protein